MVIVFRRHLRRFIQSSCQSFLASWSLWQSLSCCCCFCSCCCCFCCCCCCLRAKICCSEIKMCEHNNCFHIGFINFAPNKFVLFEIMCDLVCLIPLSCWAFFSFSVTSLIRSLVEVQRLLTFQKIGLAVQLEARQA